MNKKLGLTGIVIATTLGTGCVTHKPTNLQIEILEITEYIETDRKTFSFKGEDWTYIQFKQVNPAGNRACSELQGRSRYREYMFYDRDNDGSPDEVNVTQIKYTNHNKTETKTKTIYFPSDRDFGFYKKMYFETLKSGQVR
ncbi:hypothetical protein JW711_02025 [Candidatus Woesearchaeota archaeon]|nr:hypothetical protein [Candidatus Woesearchaeota archaeon]